MKRIQVIDVLRGFALLGIIIAHMNEGYVAGLVPDQYANYNIQNSFDNVLSHVVDGFVFGKFFTLFSLMFGLSFFIMMDRGAKKATDFKKLFSWRLVLLFIIGYVHHLFYRGDILTIYAILGFLLLSFRKSSDKKLITWALILGLNVPSLVLRIPVFYFAQQQENTEIVSGDNRIDDVGTDNEIDVGAVASESAEDPFFNYILQGKGLLIAKDNAIKGFFMKWAFQLFSGRIFVTIGMFLLGMWIGRKRFFEKIDTVFWKKTFTWSALLGIPTSLVISYYGLESVYGISWIQFFGMFIMDLSNFTMTLFYIAAIVLLFQIPKIADVLKYLAPPGQMSLTTYIMQTAFGLFLFFGYGFGKLLDTSVSEALLYAIVFYGIQIVFSRWWLSKYRYGPLEWLWRCATYRKWQPLKKEVTPLPNH